MVKARSPTRPLIAPRNLWPRATATATATFALPVTIAGRWGLCALAPIRSRDSYEEAAAVCGKLAVRRLNTVQREYQRELLALVEAYEDAPWWNCERRQDRMVFPRLRGARRGQSLQSKFSLDLGIQNGTQTVKLDAYCTGGRGLFRP